ncbi:substrate-binding periplasmic protein [Aeromonas finlandensis]|uniref:substrate-binding periplasmic protein n=1 Tax=Aeromonas finlandensis TaxID=1543375 RepID=UPI00051AE140|nr:transporter substrate-binding domain-containing protein [Aeromonas finlandensis]
MLRLIAILALMVSLTPNAKPLRFVVQHFPPYTFSDKNNNITGAYTEMVKAACKEWPDGCDIIQLPNLRARKMLQKGLVDGMFPLAKNPERSQELWFSRPLSRTSWGFFSHTDNPQTDLTFNALSGARIGVTKNSFSEYLLLTLDKQLQLQGAKPLRIDTNITDSMRSLEKLQRNSRYQFYFSNVDVALHYMEQSGNHQLKLLKISHVANYYIAFNKQVVSQDQLMAFNKILERLENEGVLLTYRVHWGLSSPSKDDNLHSLFH